MANDGFRRDLIIANDDGFLYHLTQDDLKYGMNANGESFRVDPKTTEAYRVKYGDVLELLSRGMVVAAVPKAADRKRADVTIMPIMCYVLNVDAMKHYNCWEPSQGKAPAAKKAAPKGKPKKGQAGA
jgi:hypothetical protein